MNNYTIMFYKLTHFHLLKTIIFFVYQKEPYIFIFSTNDVMYQNEEDMFCRFQGIVKDVYTLFISILKA